MASTQSTGLTRCKQWWRRSSSKKILLLLVWQVLFSFSWGIREAGGWTVFRYFLQISQFLSVLSVPLFTWLADKTFGRYEIVKCGSLISFSSSVFFYLALCFQGNESVLRLVFYSALVIVLRLGNICYSTALLPFLTDQLIGATSDELSAVVQWYIWAHYFGWGLSVMIFVIPGLPNRQVVGVGVVCYFAIPLAVIIISDCFCQHWLDRTHKVTDPMKLIMQVLNYTRKHSYPERRSAFTYIDEEQPTRIDFGKKKFGGPFTEEEVEDVKTVLQLIPLIICASFFMIAEETPESFFTKYAEFVSPQMSNFGNVGIIIWFWPVLLIPLYRFLLHRFVHRYTPSILRSLGFGLLLYLVGYILLEASTIKGVIVSDDVQQYLSCTVNTTVHPDYAVEWYWRLGPYFLIGVARTIYMVSLNMLIIAQSPDKMKGFVFGISFASLGIIGSIGYNMVSLAFTLCYDATFTILLVIVFVVYLILSKHYTLRERNREINIQAIVEEHYERYMNQEEEYMRQPHFIN